MHRLCIGCTMKVHKQIIFDRVYNNTITFIIDLSTDKMSSQNMSPQMQAQIAQGVSLVRGDRTELGTNS